ncbi:cyclic nucleotide-binding protein [Mesorhizobium sp. L-8-3]|nr:cyclic nucleotide-binding protein [Mesorhizobium sp. L-8-3]
MMKVSVADLAKRWLSRTPEALNESEQRVLRSAVERKPVSRNVNESLAEARSHGERVADWIARFGGSWNFILGFMAFLIAWTAANAWLLGQDRFDPYPFVFLNLVLSMIAAFQAPVIMMSQNRQAERDRLDAAHDYEVNLKAEIEIMALHEKLDALHHSELIAMREDVDRIAVCVARIEARLGSGPTAA